MDFSWPQGSLDYREKVIDFARSNLNSDIQSRDKNQLFPRDLWIKCANFGIQKIAILEEHGGRLTNDNFMESMLAMEGLGYGCEDNSLAFGLNAQMWTVQIPIQEFGSDEQKSKYLVPLGDGNIIGCHALTEPENGSDVYNMQMTADKVDGGYLLNGVKHLISLAPICDFAVIFAKTNIKLGKWGISAFLVDKNTEGCTFSKAENKMGMRSIPIGSISMKDCFIPSGQLLGAEGAGFSIINHSLEYDRCCILASQLGAMERQLENTIKFAKSRIQFGKSIGKFQSVSNRVADMKLRLETARLLLYKTAWLKQNDKNATLESAMLKLHLSESFVQSSMDAIRTHGGQAYLSDFGVERDLRDAVGGILYAGTSDIQRNIIAQVLGL